MTTSQPVPAPRTSHTTDPFSPGMQRLAAASGLTFVLLVILSIVLGAGETPDYDAAASEWASYASENENDVQLSSAIMGLAAFMLIWFSGYLRSHLGRAEEAARGFTRLSHIVFGGGIVAAVGFVLSASITAAAVSQPDGTSDEIIRALSVLSYYPFFVASVGIAAMLYTSAFVVMRLGVLPRWLGIVGLIGGLAYLVTLFVQLNPDDDGGALGASYPIGFLALLIFVVGASVVFLRDIGRTTSTATAP